MTQEGGKRGSGCGKAALIGCSVLVIGLFGLVALVAINFDRIGDVVREGKQTITDMIRLQGEVWEEFGVTDVHLSKKFGNDGAWLSVEFSNPSFLDDGATDAETKVREVAQFVKDRYGSSEDLDGIAVVLKYETGVGITVSNRQSFEFPIDELD